MAIDKRLLAKFIPSEERLTALETRPNFPFQIEETIIIVKDNWPFLKKLIRESHDAVKDAFKGTSLEYKIGIYEKYMPMEEEDYMDFFRRNRKKVGISEPYDDLVFGIVKESFPEEGKRITLVCVDRFSTRLYTGEKITGMDYNSEEKVSVDEKGSKIRNTFIRRACLQERYEIEFEVGFEQDSDRTNKRLWFYSFGYRNHEFSKLYEELCRKLTMRCDLSQFKKEIVNHERFGVFRFLI